MSENNDPRNQGNTPEERGRHGEQDSRTFSGEGSRGPAEPTRASSESRRSTEVPRTFPAGSNGPARVSPPVAPAQRPSGQSQSQGHGQGPGPGQSQSQDQGQGPGQSRSQSWDSTAEQPRVRPTYAPAPVDRSAGQHPQAQAPQAQASHDQGQPTPGQGGTGSGQPHPGYRPGSTGQAGASTGQPTYPTGQTGTSAGYSTGQRTDPTGQPQAAPTQSQSAPTQPQSSPTRASTGYPNSSTYAGPAGSQNYSAAYPAPGGTGGPGNHGGPGNSGGQGTYVGPQAVQGGHQGSQGGQPPYDTQDYFNGQGPYPGQAPPRREKRGPGWGATIAIALVAALLGGGAAFGGSYAVSALQGEEPRKVADQTIETPDWTEVAKQTSESVVSIQVGTSGQVQGLGSGSLYDDQGHVITNNHVVAPADTPAGEITVTMKNGETTKAEIVGRDPSTDIAIIKVEQVPDGMKPLPVGDSKKLSVGDPVMALGNPLGLADSVTTGIVSALDRPVSTENIGEDATSQEKEMTITNAIQTDAAINPGNSGGPLVDGNGSFIGVNSAAASLSQAGEGQQSGSIGIGFAIPASQAVMIADQLIASGKAQHPFLGITLTDGQINSGGITRGSAKVQSIQSGSPAEQAGFKDGDDIVAVGETKVNNAIALRALVRAQPVNTPVEFTVIRGGQEQKLDVTLVLQ